MRRLRWPTLILALVLAVLLTGCAGTGTEVLGPDPDVDRTDGAVAATTVALVSEPAVGGEVSTDPTVVRDEDDLTDFATSFTQPRMADALLAAYAGADLEDDQVLLAAVVGIGCLPPTEVEVSRTGGELVVTGVEDPRNRTVDCFAALTTVALVAVADDQV